MSEQQGDHQPTSEAVRRLATDLEISYDDSLGDSWMEKRGDTLIFYSPQNNLAAQAAAVDWLQRVRRSMEERDAIRSLDPLPRRRRRAALVEEVGVRGARIAAAQAQRTGGRA